jgi:hypothetical protein
MCFAQPSSKESLIFREVSGFIVPYWLIEIKLTEKGYVGSMAINGFIRGSPF